MADFPAMPLWTDAYLADTTHLSDAEHGRYCLMLMHLWRMPEKRFPNDDAWLARKFNRSQEQIKSEFRPLIEEFFRSDGNWISQKRLAREWHRLRKTSQRQSEAAKSRWNKLDTVSHGNAALAMQPQPQPQPESTPPDSPPRSPNAERGTPARSSERANGTRIGDWRPSESDLEFARQQGVPGHDLPEVEAEFHDYWCAVPGQRGRKLNWPATWKNHIRSHVAPRYRQRSNGNGYSAHSRGPPARRPSKGEYADVVRRLDVCDPDPAAYIAAKNKARAQ